MRLLRAARLIGLSLIAVLAPAQVCQVNGSFVTCINWSGSVCCISCVSVACDDGSSCTFCQTACPGGISCSGGCGFDTDCSAPEFP